MEETKGLSLRALTRVCGAERLSGDKLGAVDELGEVGPRRADDGGGRNGPAFRVDFTADLIIHQLHLFAALKSLEQTKAINPNPTTQPEPPPTEGGQHLHDEVDVHGEGLDSVEAGDERDGEEALGVHLPPQEEVTFQIVEAEVVLTAAVDTGTQDRHEQTRPDEDLFLLIMLTRVHHQTREDIMQNIYLYSLSGELSMTKTCK